MTVFWQQHWPPTRSTHTHTRPARSPTCSSGKTVHLTGAVTGVKEKTERWSSPSRV